MDKTEKSLQNALDALKALKKCVLETPGMNHSKFVGLGIQVNNAIDEAEACLRQIACDRAKQDIRFETKMKRAINRPTWGRCP